MTIDFFTVFITVFSLLILVIPGYLLGKLKIFGEGADSAFSALVLFVLQPMLMIVGFQTKFDSSIAINMLIVAGLALAVHLIMIGLMYLIIRNKSKDTKLNVLRFSSVFSNCGYMGLPFLKTLFADSPELLGQILIYGSVVIAIFNILNWSIGIFMITGDVKKMSLKRAIFNPTVIAIFIGLIFFFAVGTPLKDVAPQGSRLDSILERVMQSVNSLADAVTPISMIVIGLNLSKVKTKSLFLDKWAYVSSGFKLIVMSIITMLVVAFLPIDNTVKYAIFFTLSMPSATGTVLFAVMFGADGSSASVNVLLSTILSILTIPLMFLLFSSGFGIAL